MRDEAVRSPFDSLIEAYLFTLGWLFGFGALGPTIENVAAVYNCRNRQVALLPKCACGLVYCWNPRQDSALWVRKGVNLSFIPMNPAFSSALTSRYEFHR